MKTYIRRQQNKNFKHRDIKQLEMRVCMLVPKLAVCMIHLFHSNAVKFNFLKKLFGCDCFDLDPETECKLFCRQVRNEVKI